MVESIIVWLIIGAIAGWAAGQIMRGYGFGLVGNIFVGIIGAIVAGCLLPLVGLAIGGGNHQRNYRCSDPSVCDRLVQEVVPAT